MAWSSDARCLSVFLDSEVTETSALVPKCLGYQVSWVWSVSTPGYGIFSTRHDAHR